jgi:3'-phosphoadenosine 5'-phosphosulfate (PAPS) 3'-phosphatase
MAYHSELDIAINAVVKASRLCRHVQDSLVSDDTVEKKDRSPVTIADLGSQAVINLELLQSFPNDPIISEEDTDTFFPLNYDRPEEGKGCLFYAVEGKGAFMQGLDQDKRERIHVDSISHSPNARFVEPVEKAHASHTAHAQISSALGITAPSYRMDSQCKYAAVARGDVSIYLRLPKDKSYQEKIWDHAAGSVIVHEAGGRVTDIYGKPLDFSRGRKLQNNKGVVATNGKLHEKVLNAILVHAHDLAI